jgi:transketolase
MKREANAETVRRLEHEAIGIRSEVIRMVHRVQSGHIGGSLSETDILTALYYQVMNIDPKRPDDPDRDRFVLSKGHACPAWYATLARRGFFPVDVLSTLRQFGSPLQGHPVQAKAPGIEVTSGSLGIGFAQAVGMAINARIKGAGYRIWTLLGDGETNEGIVWESALFANKYRLDNLCAIVDNNRVQNDGFGADILPMEPLDEKFAAFGWNVLRINGHDMAAVLAALEEARTCSGKPTVIIADTVKGKGVDFMENDRHWHGKPPTDEQAEEALKQLAGGLRS